MDVARDVAAAYGRDASVAAVVLAGSVGRGHADRHSDVEVDVYWSAPPTDAARREAIEAADGKLKKLWAYEPAEGEWSEDFMVAGLPVTVSGFTVAWLTDAISRRSDFDILTQMRLSALMEGTPLLGAEHVEQWRSKALYTDELALSAICHYLDMAPLSSWRHRAALVEREDSVPLHHLCTDMVTSLLGLLCAVNHVYVSHPRFKWATHTMSKCMLAPAGLSDRLSTALNGPTENLARTVHALYSETLGICGSAYPIAQVKDAYAALHAPRHN